MIDTDKLHGLIVDIEAEERVTRLARKRLNTILFKFL